MHYHPGNRVVSFCTTCSTSDVEQIGVHGTIGRMEEIFAVYKKEGDLHHTYLIEGDAEVVRAALGEHLRASDLPHEGHPDFWAGEFESLGIDESRELKAAQMGSPVAGTRRVFVVGAGSITHEAQNALLKVFEDPTPGTHFFVIVPSAHALLPTLRSRMMILAGGERTPEPSVAAETFLNASLKERMEIAKKVAEKKDRLAAIALAEGILQALHREGVSLERAHALAAAERVRGYLNDRAPSVKMLFEYLALVV